MTLPLDPSNPPMEARPVGNLPEGEQWRYEVRYHQATEGRLRHGTTLRRRRFDKAPQRCDFDQLAMANGGKG
jgi:ATP-dependent DNA ligase